MTWYDFTPYSIVLPIDTAPSKCNTLYQYAAFPVIWAMKGLDAVIALEWGGNGSASRRPRGFGLAGRMTGSRVYRQKGEQAW